MDKTAILWRMDTPDHLCPYGLKAKDLLERKGFRVEDHLLKSKAEADKFKAEHHIETTPQAFIDDRRIGGYDAVRQFFGMKKLKDTGTKYDPVIAIFAVSLAMAGAFTWYVGGSFSSPQLLFWFIAIAMILLAVQKLKDLSGFSLQFITYDVLAMRWIPYSYIYPFAEAYTGVGMLAGFPPLAVAPVGIFIGTVGAVSIVKAVYIEKKAIKCACVGGDSEVPLGFISLTENLLMLGAGVWMLLRM